VIVVVVLVDRSPGTVVSLILVAWGRGCPGPFLYWREVEALCGKRLQVRCSQEAYLNGELCKLSYQRPFLGSSSAKSTAGQITLF